MDDALRMDVIEGAGNVPEIAAGFFERKRTPANPIAQRPPFHQGHHHIIARNAIKLTFAGIIDRQQMSMMQRGHQPRLSYKARQQSLVFPFEDLDRDLTLEMRIVSLVDIGHTPSTKHLPQFIAVEAPPLQTSHIFSPKTIRSADKHSFSLV